MSAISSFENWPVIRLLNSHTLLIFHYFLYVILLYCRTLLFQLGHWFRLAHLQPGVIFHVLNGETFRWILHQQAGYQTLGQSRKIGWVHNVHFHYIVLQGLLLSKQWIDNLLSRVLNCLMRSEWSLSSQQLESKNTQTPIVQFFIMPDLQNHFRCQIIESTTIGLSFRVVEEVWPTEIR